MDQPGAPKYDVATCMFAIHYFFVTEAGLKQFMRNVSLNLKIGEAASYVVEMLLLFFAAVCMTVTSASHSDKSVTQKHSGAQQSAVVNEVLHASVPGCGRLPLLFKSTDN